MEKSYVMIPTKEFEDLVKKVNDIYDFLKVGSHNNISEINGFVTEEDAIKIVKKSKNWLWRKRKDVYILFKKLGAKTYYFKEDLYNLLKD